MHIRYMNILCMYIRKNISPVFIVMNHFGNILKLLMLDNQIDFVMEMYGES